MGCGVLASLLPELSFENVLLLAPAVDHPGPKIKKYMFRKYQAKEVKPNLYAFARKNGSQSYFSQTYVDEFDLKFSQIYEQNLKLAKRLMICVAGHDWAGYKPPMEAFLAKYPVEILSEADHNFSDQSRVKIASTAAQFFKQGLTKTAD